VFENINDDAIVLPSPLRLLILRPYRQLHQRKPQEVKF